MAEKPPSPRQLFVDFMSYTTSHGLGRLAASTNTLWKLFWILSFLGTATMFIYQVYSLFLIYQSRPVQTSVYVKYEKQLAFPAVTICNLNMIKSDKLPIELEGILDSNNTYQNAKTEFNITRDKKDEGEYLEFDYSEYVSPEAERTLETGDEYADISDEYPDEDELDDETKLRTSVELLLGKSKPSELYFRGHLMKDLISTCSWKGADCKKGNLSNFWTKNWNYRYGNCYTFNNGVDKENKPLRVLKASKPGPTQGLALTLNIEQNLYVGGLTQGAGVRVVLHKQGAMPFPFEEGFSVTPGLSTSVGITKRVIKRLDRFAKGDCLKKATLSKRNIYKTFRNVTRYSQQACLNSCLGQSQWYTCGCSESAYPSKDIPCNTFNTKERNCLRVIKNLFNNDQLACLHECKKPCSEDIYLRTISSSQWPSTAYKVYYSSSQNESNNTSEELNKNTLELKIFYSVMNYEAIEEKFSYETTNLLADIGGQLGLWIGISVLTVCELLELILKFVTLVFTKLKTRNRVTEIRQAK